MPTRPPRPARRGSAPSLTPRARLMLLAVGAAAVATIRSARAAHAAAREREAARAAAAQPESPRASAYDGAQASAPTRRREVPRPAPDEIPTPPVLPPHAHFPAPWVGLIGSDVQASAFDPGRLAVAGDTVTVWTRTQFPRDVPAAVGGPAGVRAIEVSHQVRCAAARARATGSMVLLGAAGDTLGERRAWDPGAWQPLDPTLAKVCRCLACARGRRAAPADRPAGGA